MQRELAMLYDEHALLEHQFNETISIDFQDLMTRKFGDEAGVIAAEWWKTITEVGAERTDIMSSMRAWERGDMAEVTNPKFIEWMEGLPIEDMMVRGKNVGARRITWPQFIEEMYLPTIDKGLRAADEFAIRTYDQMMGKLDIDPAQSEAFQLSKEAIWKQRTDMPKFKQWFGDSKIMDAEGNPLQVYHGTEAKVDFTKFKTHYSPKEQLGFGIHFTPDTNFVSLYATDKGGRVIPGYIKIDNLLDADAIVKQGTVEYELAEKIVAHTKRRLSIVKDESGVPSVYLQNVLDLTSPKRAERIVRESGYDGIKYLAEYGTQELRGANISNEAVSYIVFEPDQFRSAFDPELFPTKAQEPAITPELEPRSDLDIRTEDVATQVGTTGMVKALEIVRDLNIKQEEMWTRHTTENRRTFEIADKLRNREEKNKLHRQRAKIADAEWQQHKALR